jgi:hypothetical protein
MRLPDRSSPAWVAGLVAGVLAFGATFLLVREFVRYGHGFSAGVGVEDWQLQAWFSLGAHHVPVQSTVSGEAGSAVAESTNPIAASSPRFNFLYLVPPVSLFVGGVLLADRRGGEHSPGYSMVNGATIFVGYVIAALAVGIFSAWSSSALGVSGRVGPGILRTFVLAGLAYPMGFGALGGLAHHVAKNV